MAKLEKVEGIGQVFANKLRDAGIPTAEALLEKGSSPQDRKALSKETGISSKVILEWVNHVDLFRIKGVGEEYADLLEEAGVDTVVELAQRNPDNLHAKIIATNEEKALVRRVPPLVSVRDWVAQAKELPRKITY